MTLPAGEILLGDCKEVMAGWPDSVVDTFICDPPYGLHFMGKEWDKPRIERRTQSQVVNLGAGMRMPTHQETLDFQDWTREWAEAALRVAKPGAMLLAFGGTRTFHRLACALEDAGWEIRDTIMWLYGSGFPKSRDISKAIDKANGAEREVVKETKSGGYKRQMVHNAEDGFRPADYYPEGNKFTSNEAVTDAAKIWNGWGTALKPAWEPIIVAMKPCDGTFADNAQKHGVAGLDIDGGRIKTSETLSVGSNRHENGVVNFGMKDNREGQDVSMKGRWPANVILDEQAGALLDAQSGASQSTVDLTDHRGRTGSSTFAGDEQVERVQRGDSGGASRFFYCAKADRKERELGLEGKARPIGHNRFDTCAKCGGTILQNPDRPSACKCENPERQNKTSKNDHPTVKPIALMRYLCRLTKTPAGGVVVDPFAGSGSTLIAARLEGRPFVGIEIDAQYRDIALARLSVVPDSLFAEVKK